MNPVNLKYSQEHEWVRSEADNAATIGITMFAVESLGDIVFVELPEKGGLLSQFVKMGEIESVKAVSDLYSPISGQVLERNEELINNPELINENSYESGWMLKIQISNPSELDNLMSSNQYETFLASQK